MAETYGITELAREFKVTTRAIRYYEDKGMIAPARQGQRRIFGPRDRVRLRLIMRGKRLGFSLDEVREMLDLYEVGPGEIAQLSLFLAKIKQRRAVLRQHQRDVETKLEEMDKLEEQCARLLADREAAHTGAG